MSYGSITGLQNNMRDYAQLLSSATITAAGVTEARKRADQKIDTMLSSVVPLAMLPLASHGPVDGISDDYTACYLYRGIYAQKDPNESAWVKEFCERAADDLEDLLKHPEILVDPAGDQLNQMLPESTTLDQDRVFTASTTSGDGATTIIDGTMEDW